MNIKQQLKQVIAEMEDALIPVDRAEMTDFYSRLSTIVEQMNADEQAIVEEVNKRWPTGKPQPDNTFVGTATMKLSTPKRGEFVNDSGEQMPSASAEPVAYLHVMDNTDGLEENNPYEVLSFDSDSSSVFGLPGKDYSAEYPITVTPLYATPQVPDGMVLVPEVLLRQISKWLAESADPYDKAAYAINGLIAAAKEEV